MPLSASEILPLGVVELLLISIPALAESADVELQWVISEVRHESSGSSPEIFLLSIGEIEKIYLEWFRFLAR